MFRTSSPERLHDNGMRQTRTSHFEKTYILQQLKHDVPGQDSSVLKGITDIQLTQSVHGYMQMWYQADRQ